MGISTKFRFIEIKNEANQIPLLKINRPEKKNALSLQLMDELCAGIKALEEAKQRVVIIEAEGSTFSSGLDLNEAKNPELIETTAAHVAKMLSTLINSPLVTIAAVGGDALAGGAGLVAACDLVVMSKTAFLSFPEVRRGLVAALVASILARQISTKHLMELLITGEPISAESAHKMGVINHITEKENVMTKAYKMAENILQGGPEAVRLTKKLIGDLTERTLGAEIQHALALHYAVRNSDEAIEGVTSFLEKRSPRW